MYLVISASLKSDSRSRIMAQDCLKNFQSRGQQAELIDLREYQLPLCDGEAAYGHELVPVLSQKFLECEGIILATPIYNFSLNAAAKNLIELTGRNWQEKPVGFLCAAGGTGSYMSIMSIASSLMLDFRCLILPKFVYAMGEDFEGDQIRSETIESRIAELSATMIRISKAWNSTQGE